MSNQVACLGPLKIRLLTAGPSTSLRSGRDDNLVAKCEYSRESSISK
jgi:hypothetical protein